MSYSVLENLNKKHAGRMKVHDLIEQLRNIESKFGNIEVMVVDPEKYSAHPILYKFKVEIGTEGNHGDFVLQEEVSRLKWDSIIDMVALVIDPIEK